MRPCREGNVPAPSALARSGRRLPRALNGIPTVRVAARPPARSPSRSLAMPPRDPAWTAMRAGTPQLPVRLPPSPLRGMSGARVIWGVCGTGTRHNSCRAVEGEAVEDPTLELIGETLRSTRTACADCAKRNEREKETQLRPKQCVR